MGWLISCVVWFRSLSVRPAAAVAAGHLSESGINPFSVVVDLVSWLVSLPGWMDGRSYWTGLSSLRSG